MLRLSANCRHEYPVEPKVISDADPFLSYREVNLVALNQAIQNLQRIRARKRELCTHGGRRKFV